MLRSHAPQSISFLSVVVKVALSFLMIILFIVNSESVEDLLHFGGNMYNYSSTGNIVEYAATLSIIVYFYTFTYDW